MLQSYKELTVWQKSISLVQAVYSLTSKFPKEEVYGLSSQMRRAAISIPSNIAEGQRRKDIPEFLQFLRIADASSAELETQLIISKKLYPKLDYSLSEGLLEEVQKMLNVLISKLELKTINYKLKTATSGFTLLELLVTIGIISVVSVAAFLSLSGYGGAKSMERALEEMTAATKAAQNSSITQQDGKTWGVRFSNPATSTDKYEIFSGLTYSQGSVSKLSSFRNNVSFSNPTASSVIDTVFTAISGKPSQNQIISLTSNRRDNLVGDLIINGSGFIGSRLEKGLVGYWHLDEGVATTTYDASGNANTGTLTNGPTWQSGANCKAGGCLSFDGTDDYVRVANNPIISPTTAITVSGWFYVNSLTNIVGSFVSKRNSYILHPNPDGSLTFYVFVGGGWNAVATAASSISLNEWQYWVASYDGSTIRIYRNGTLLNSGAVTAGSIGTSGDVVIGSDVDCGCGTRYLNGRIDEVRIYNRALSATEILNHYNDLK